MKRSSRVASLLFAFFLTIPCVATPAAILKCKGRLDVLSIQTKPMTFHLNNGTLVVEGDSPHIDEMSNMPTKLTIVGPALGSMDSSDIKPELTCTDNGLRLTSTIVRSAAYHGQALQNIVWNPRINLTLDTHQPGQVIEVVWKMHLTSGVELNQAESMDPSHAMLHFPLTMTKHLTYSKHK